MNIVLSATKDSYWEAIVKNLKMNKIETSYWVGRVMSNSSLPKECFFHEVINAYELKSLYETQPRFFDIKNIELSEYYTYMKILDRGDDIGGYSFSMRDRLLKEQLNYWYSVLLDINPDAIIYSNVPHLLYDYPMYLIAKYLKIKTLIFNVTPFAGWHYVTNSIFSSVNANNLVKVNDGNDLIKEQFYSVAVKPYENFKYEIPYYMKNQYNYDKDNNSLGLLRKYSKKKLRNVALKFGLIDRPKPMRDTWRHNFFTYTGEDNVISNTVHLLIIDRYKHRLKQEYQENVVSHRELNKVNRYVYIPLHYQPEATTAPYGEMYSDQIYMIERLRDILPKDVNIIVKEHYSQFTNMLYGFRGRHLGYYKKLSSIHNTYLAPLDYNQRKLIMESLCVATVTGTAGWEAIQFGKYSIVFGEPWYFQNPQAVHFEDLKSDLLNRILNGDKPLNVTDEFLNTFCKSLIKSDIHNYSNGMVERSTDIVIQSILTFLNSEISNANQ